jgi:hypothetical protein
VICCDKARTAIIWLLAAVLFVQCGKNEEIAQPSPFTSAELRLFMNGDGTTIANGPTRVERVIVVRDSTTLSRLASYFPEMGRGKKAGPPHGWRGRCTITFKINNESRITVTTNFDWWTEGHGDWTVSNELLPFVQGILRDGTTATNES